jgi:competence protein ComEA
MRGASEEIPIAPSELSVAETVAQVTVDVAGAVKSPGVYTLPANSRVVDAIKAAGSQLRGADLSDINLARVIKDGEQIYIYPPNKVGGAVRISPQRTKVKNTGPIALNRASAKELETLDGIGPVLAARIVAYRNENGPFLIVDDLMKVSGIGTVIFSKLKEKLRV